MKRGIVIAIILALMAGAFSIGVAAASGDDARQPAPNEVEAVPLLKSADGLKALTAGGRGVAAKCGTACKLAKLTRRFNRLVRCLGLMGLTSYGEDPGGGSEGYFYEFSDASNFLTTAVDFDPGQNQLVGVFWTC